MKMEKMLNIALINVILQEHQQISTCILLPGIKNAKVHVHHFPNITTTQKLMNVLILALTEI